MPLQNLTSWKWSPSRIELYQLCNERFRRRQLERDSGLESVGNYDAEIGAAFHRGIAEVFRQVWGLE
jgi:hypothetical protein